MFKHKSICFSSQAVSLYRLTFNVLHRICHTEIILKAALLKIYILVRHARNLKNPFPD